ncbi:hypothetical protein ACH5RR_018049 [Cinchona calisaya]|uniref:Uncharacterized protein n=1 Tax=Cinchona calisaya TaxID=153742 RepID=A0ABD2ZNY3_9GENT
MDHETQDSKKPTKNLPQSSSGKLPIGSSTSSTGSKYPNPPELKNPDPATLREQWKFAIRQYSRWYSHAWGTAILAGLSFFALGWVIKGSNPLPSFKTQNPEKYDDKSNVPEKANQG